MADWEDADFDPFDELSPKRQRGLVMRHPILLILVILGSAFVAHRVGNEVHSISLRPRTAVIWLKGHFFNNKTQTSYLHSSTMPTVVYLVQASPNVFATPKKDGYQPGHGPDSPVLILKPIWKR